MCGDSWYINLGEYCVDTGDTINLGEYSVDTGDILILVNTVWIQVTH